LRYTGRQPKRGLCITDTKAIIQALRFLFFFAREGGQSALKQPRISIRGRGRGILCSSVLKMHNTR
jgi:hypothetical protein